MTAISVSYNKNITGEEFPPISQFRITYFRPDGQLATDDDVADIHMLVAKAAAQASTSRRRSSEPEWSDGGYRVEVERDGALPMTFGEVQCCMLFESMQRLDAVQEVEVVTTPKATLAAVNGLPLLGVQAWAAAVQQLEPESDNQVVMLLEPEGAQVLLDAGLVERYDGDVENQYIVPRAVAYCSVESRRLPNAT